MKYAKIIDSLVVQVQPNKQKGFIEVDDSVVAGMVQDDDSFIIPEYKKTYNELLEECHQLRQHNYDIGKQIGAIMKQFEKDRMEGKALIQELDDALGHVHSVKMQNPLPEKGE